MKIAPPSAAAVLGIIGFLDIPLIHMSVYWWRTLHQPPSILRPDKAPWENVHPAMLTALAISFVGFLLLYFYLLSLRYRFGEMRAEIKARRLGARRLMGAWGFVGLAYGIVWGIIVLYLISLKRRYNSAQAELDRAQLGGGDGSRWQKIDVF